MRAQSAPVRRGASQSSGFPKAAIAIFAASILAASAPKSEPALARVNTEPPSDLETAPLHIGGRVEAKSVAGEERFRRQWPGTYFEASFVGRDVFFKVGTGEVILRLLVDGRPMDPVIRPEPGFYEIDGLSSGAHTVRIEVVSESQAGPTEFAGFYTRGRRRPPAPRARMREIEFIGDSHTVGYANRSNKHQCTEEEVWSTTDTSAAPGPLVAKHYGADYQINAISGRGVVRNYDGSGGATLPAAYPFVLFDRPERYDGDAWRPQVIVIGLGTNDFSTPLNSGEPWTSRDALRSDFEASYVKFVQALRAKNPQAFIVLLTTWQAQGETGAEVSKVAAKLKETGEARVGVVAVGDLAYASCNFHPSISDDRKIADALISFLDAAPHVWR